MSVAVDDVARRIRERGHAILEDLYPADRLQRIGDALDELYARLGQPRLHARDPIWFKDGIEVAGPGLAIYRLLAEAPALAADLFTAPALAALRALLGDTMHLELVGAVFSDHARPFTEWETHLGGIDDERWRRAGHRPRLTSVQRVVHFLFLEDLDADTGPWFVLPRAVGDPVDPPASIHAREWPGAEPITCRAGSVLLLEQSVWHCVHPRVRPGRRRFVGAYFAGPEAAPTEARDASLDALATDPDVGEPLATLLRHRPAADVTI